MSLGDHASTVIQWFFSAEGTIADPGSSQSSHGRHCTRDYSLLPAKIPRAILSSSKARPRNKFLTASTVWECSYFCHQSPVFCSRCSGDGHSIDGAVPAWLHRSLISVFQSSYGFFYKFSKAMIRQFHQQ
jgi:hypothetical protein